MYQLSKGNPQLAAWVEENMTMEDALVHFALATYEGYCERKQLEG